MQKQLQEIENRIEALSKEANELRVELQTIKGETGTGAPQKSSPKKSSIINQNKSDPLQEKTQSAASTPKKKGAIDKFFDSLTQSFLQDAERFLGGNIFARLGLFAVLLACTWLINYAIDNRWLNESTRIWVLLIFGYALTLYGLWLSKKSFKILPGAIIGTGMGISFLTIYSAYYFYSLTQMSETFIAMAFYSAMLLLYSIWTNRQLLYLYAFTGAILLPLLFSTGENSYQFLFSYLLFWNVVHFILSLKKDWKIAPWFILLSSHGIFWGWSNNIENSGFLIPFFSMVSIFALFYFRDIIRNKNRLLSNDRSIFSLLNIFLNYFVMSALLSYHYIDYKPMGNLTVSFFSVFLMHDIFQKNILEDKAKKILTYGLGALAALFLYSGILQITEKNYTPLFLTVYTFLLGIFAWKIFRVELMVVSAILYLHTLLMVWTQIDLSNYTPIFNLRFALSLVLAYLGFSKGISSLRKNVSVKISAIYFFVAGFTLLWASFLENYDSIDSLHYRNLGYSYILAFYGILSLGVGMAKKNQYVRYTGLGLLGILILKFYLYDIFSLKTSIRIIAGFSLGITLMIIGIVVEKYRKQQKEIL